MTTAQRLSMEGMLEWVTGRIRETLVIPDDEEVNPDDSLYDLGMDRLNWLHFCDQASKDLSIGGIATDEEIARHGIPGANAFDAFMREVTPRKLAERMHERQPQ